MKTEVKKKQRLRLLFGLILNQIIPVEIAFAIAKDEFEASKLVEKIVVIRLIYGKLKNLSYK